MPNTHDAAARSYPPSQFQLQSISSFQMSVAQILTRELESVGIRLNRKPPNLYFKRKKTGGVSISSTVPLTQLDDKLVYRILQV